MITFLRILKTGVTSFWRHIWLSAAATLVMIITLVTLSVLLILYSLTQYSVGSIKERVDVSAYFKTGTTEANILAIREELVSLPEVKSVNYTSPSEALQEFKDKHRGSQLVLQSLDELTDNPLPASLQIKAKNLDDYPAIAANLEQEKYKDIITKVNYEDNRQIIERLNRVLGIILTSSITLGVIFSLAAILVIVNTFTLTIYNRREEIEIMRLVGATNWYIRGPFLVEGLLYSLVATLVTGLIFLPVFSKYLPTMLVYIAPDALSADTALSGSFILSGPGGSFFMLLIAQLTLSVILSTASSWFAMRKYLQI